MTAVDDALDRLYARVAVNEKACADLATVRDELQRLRDERMTVFNLNAEHDERVVAPYVARAEAAEHDLAMERSLNADYKAANEKHLAELQRLRDDYANLQDALAYEQERVRQLEDGLREIRQFVLSNTATYVGDPPWIVSKIDALLAADSPPEECVCGETSTRNCPVHGADSPPDEEWKEGVRDSFPWLAADSPPEGT